MDSSENEDTSMATKSYIILIIAAIYFIAGKLGLALAIPGTNVTPIWPPSGIALAAVLILGAPTLISIFLGSFILNINTIISLHPPMWHWYNTLFVSLLTALGATLQAALGAYLIQEYIQAKPYSNRINSVLKFLAFTAVSCLVNASLGTFAITANGLIKWETFSNTWWTWWIGDAVGIITVTPLIFAWILYPLTHWTVPKAIEAATILVLVAITALLNLSDNPFYSYLFLPLIIWALIRFQLAGATLVIFLITIAVIFETLNGYGSFIRYTLNASLISLGLFIMIQTAITLVLSAKLTRRTASIFVWHGSSETVQNLLEQIKSLITPKR